MPLPISDNIAASRVASEVAALVGTLRANGESGDDIIYALLSQCKSQIANTSNRSNYDANKRRAADYILA